MLVVLSEIDCLDYIRAKGVHPAEFYTDIEAFKNNAVLFQDATILVIFAGNCRFNKKHTVKLVKDLMKRSESKSDRSIAHIYVVSDLTIAGLKSYYKYEGSIDTVKIMRGWDAVKDGVNIWLKLRNKECETKTYYSAYDKGDITGALSEYEDRYRGEDSYRELIQVPDVNKLYGITKG